MFPAPRQFLHSLSPPCLCSDTESISHPTPGSAPFQEKQVAPGTASQKAMGAGARPRECVCVCGGGCSHIATPTMPPLGMGGTMASRAHRGGLGGAEHAVLEPARPECSLGSAAVLLRNQGHLSRTPSSAKWAHNGLASPRGLSGGPWGLCAGWSPAGWRSQCVGAVIITAGWDPCGCSHGSSYPALRVCKEGESTHSQENQKTEQRCIFLKSKSHPQETVTRFKILFSFDRCEIHIT